MKLFVTPGPREADKFAAVVSAFPQIWEGLVLDVGCRSGKLKAALAGRNVKYWGLDLAAPAGVIANLEKGLPFPPVMFHVVAALDVLEHTDEIYRAFEELCAVARRYVVITLPNAVELVRRWKFARGQLGGKYGLPVESPPDRHRWLFSFSEAVNFCRARAPRAGFRILREGCLIGARRGLPGVRQAVARYPDLLCPTYLVLLGRDRDARGTLQ